MTKAWALVARVQKLSPGWRFSLLGGDYSYGYRSNKDGTLKRNKHGDLIVARKAAPLPFGWKAEFFGHMDPAKNYGDRHASAYGYTAEQAITVACRAALKKLGAK